MEANKTIFFDGESPTLSEFERINFFDDFRRNRSWLIHYKDTLKAFGAFKNKQKSVWSNVFWYVKVYIFWKCIQYTVHWDETQILKKFPSGRINVTKNTHFFLLRAPTHHSFTFNLQFL